MKTIHVVWMLALAVPPVLVSSGCATRMIGERVDDGHISRHVQRRLLRDPDVDRFRIDVDTIQHVTTLRGKVDSPAMSAAAERVARDTSGVRGVNNLLVVDPRDDNDDGDLRTRMRVGRRLTMASDVDRRSIDVDVQNAVVTLSGVVHDDLARTTAERIARDTEGVEDVRNELTVNPDDQLLRRDDDIGEPTYSEPAYNESTLPEECPASEMPSQEPSEESVVD